MKKRNCRQKAAHYRPKKGRPPKETPDWAPTFLGALHQGAHVRDACAVAGVEPSSAYRRRPVDVEFRKAWKEAIEIGTLELEREAIRRAYHGTLKPVFHKGVQVGEVREYSDVLMIRLLEARKPKKYRANFKFTGKINGQLQIVGIRVRGPEPAAAPSPTI